MGRRQKADARIGRLQHRLCIALRRDLVHRDQLRRHPAQQQLDIPVLLPAAQDVAPPQIEAAQLTAAVGDADADAARQNAAQVAQQRRLSNARRRQDQRAFTGAARRQKGAKLLGDPRERPRDAQVDRGHIRQHAAAIVFAPSAAETKAVPAPDGDEPLPDLLLVPVVRQLCGLRRHLLQIVLRDERARDLLLLS